MAEHHEVDKSGIVLGEGDIEQDQEPKRSSSVGVGVVKLWVKLGMGYAHELIDYGDQRIEAQSTHRRPSEEAQDATEKAKVLTNALVRQFPDPVGLTAKRWKPNVSSASCPWYIFEYLEPYEEGSSSYIDAISAIEAAIARDPMIETASPIRRAKGPPLASEKPLESMVRSQLLIATRAKLNSEVNSKEALYWLCQRITSQTEVLM